MITQWFLVFVPRRLSIIICRIFINYEICIYQSISFVFIYLMSTYYIFVNITFIQ